jgi:hypothetical protein
LAALVLQRQNRPSQVSTNESSDFAAEKRKKEIYMLQISPSLYTSCDPQGNTFQSNQQKSFREKTKEFFQLMMPNFSLTSNSSRSFSGIPEVSPKPKNAYSLLSQSSHKGETFPKRSAPPSIELPTLSRNDSVDLENQSRLSNAHAQEEEEEIVILTREKLDQELKLISEYNKSDEKSGASSPLTPDSSVLYIRNQKSTNSSLIASATSGKSNQCVVCLSHTANSIIYDCGHSVTCLPCGISIARKPSTCHCPICRSNITVLLEMSSKPFPSSRVDGKMMVVSRCGYYFQVFTSSDNRNNTFNPLIRSNLTNRNVIPNTVSVFAVNNSISCHDSIMDIILN